MSPTSPKASWRTPILEHFTPEIAAVARLTLVADPDCLLTEQGVLDSIRQRGFELIPFEDHVAFRFAFESRYRQFWDRGEDTTLVVVLRAGRIAVQDLPYDLLEQARRHSRLLSFSLGELFPSLAPQAIAALDRADLEPLYQAQRTFRPERLGEKATQDFILRHVFQLAPELVTSTSDLLRVLLRRHYRRRALPRALDERFIHLLEKTGQWPDWPLEQIVPDRGAFLAFLEERWPSFVERRSGVEARPRKLRYAGPEKLPFDHDDVRVYIDNLFVEGHLAPTDAVPKAAVRGTWIALGVLGDAEEDARQRLTLLLERLRDELPTASADHLAWVEVAQRWAAAATLRWQLPASALKELHDELETLHDQIEAGFTAWMLEHYASLHNLAYWPKPVMVHHVPHFLAHRFVPTGAQAAGQPPGKQVLVVVDGLALDQWLLLRHDLETHGGMTAEDGTVFAWVPTLTAVSRQSIFAANPPLYFASHLDRTSKEPRHWQRFWSEQGARKSEVGYVGQKKQEDEEAFLARVRELAEHPKLRVLGVVVGTIDQTIHGNVMGGGGMHAAVRHWSEIGRFHRLVALLRENDYEIFITADHGNIEALGMGKPNVGAIADERGERVHVFRDDLTRDRVHAAYAGTVAWPQIGLPENYRPLLALGRRAFLHEGKRTVAHGGISIEEVIVPFARLVERDEA